jgi:hypothetical protein
LALKIGSVEITIMPASNENIVKDKSELISELFGGLYPDLEREATSLSKSEIDVGVWLVGFSTGVLALLISYENIGSLLSESSFRNGLFAFFLVVFFGVVQRMIFHIAEHMRLPITIQLRMLFIVLNGRNRVARELDHNWTVEDIVQRLREDFGLDYSFLIDQEADIRRARECHQGNLEILRDFENKGLATLANIICTHTGLSKELEGKYFEPRDMAGNENTRVRAKQINLIYRASNIVYYCSIASFVFGIGVLALGAI